MKSRTQFSLTAKVYDKRGRLLSVGENSYRKTHPVQGHYAKEAGRPEAVYLHAEIAALIKLKDPQKAHRIVVERYSKDGKPLSAKPCEICRMALEQTSIKIIEHT